MKPYKVVNKKAKPPWPDSRRSYPIEAHVGVVPGCVEGEFDRQYLYKVVCRYERHDGDIVSETHRFFRLGDAKARCRDLINTYTPGRKPNILTLGEL